MLTHPDSRATRNPVFVVRPAVLSDLADLVLGRQCLGCGVPAPGICPACLTGLRAGTIALPGSPVPATAAREYSGLTRTLIIEYKKYGYRSLDEPLGWLLADAVWSAMRSEQLASCTIVPIHAHPRSRRSFDALGSITRAAGRALTGAGVAVRPECWLRPGSDYGTLKSLGRSARQAEVTGAFRALPAPPAHAPVIVVDDVMTTGATVGEAVDTLQRARIHVAAIAVIAATSPGRSVMSPARAPATRRS